MAGGEGWRHRQRVLPGALSVETPRSRHAHDALVRRGLLAETQPLEPDCEHLECVQRIGIVCSRYW